MGVLKKMILSAACVVIGGCVDSEVSSEDFDSVNTDVSSNTNTLTTLNSSVSDNADRLFVLESALDELQDDMLALQDEYSTLEASYRASELRVNTLLSQISINTQSIDALEDAQATFATVESLNASYSTLLEGFPDAIEIGASNVVRQVFYILNSGEHNDQVTYWHPADVGATELNTIMFNADGSYADCSGTGCNGSNQAISQFNTAGDSFNFVQDTID